MLANISGNNQNKAILSVTKLRRRYTVALSLIAFLIIMSQIIIQILFAGQTHDSHIVNIAGRQRMMSQKITKLSYYITTAESKSSASRYRKELKETADLWKKSHLGLTQGSVELALPGENSKEIVTLFNNIQFHYEEILKAANIISSSKDTNELKENTRNISLHEANFLKGMDQIVFQYDSEANAKVAFTKGIEILLMVLTLVVLMLEVIFIFSPATRSLQQGMQKLNQHKRDLQNLFAASPIAMLLVDPVQFSILQINQKAETLIGNPFDTNSIATLSTYLDPDYEHNDIFMNKLKRGKNLNEYEIVILNAQGALFETLASVRSVIFNGKPTAVIGITNISELKKAQQQLMRYASFDDMTGLLNRRTGLTFLDKSMKQVNRNKNILSVCYIDIDGLKHVNDKYGHAEGDWLIQIISQAFINIIRSSDTGVRLGGDEFLLILHDCAYEDTIQLIGRVKTALKETQLSQQKPFVIDFSYGIATYTADRNIMPDELISESDVLMYRSKHDKKCNIK